MLCRQHCCNQYCDPVNVILSITKFTVPNISFFHCIDIYFQRVRICLCSDNPFSQTFPDPLSVPFFVDGPLFLYSVGPKRSGIPDLVRRIRTKVPKMVRNWALGPDLGIFLVKTSGTPPSKSDKTHYWTFIANLCGRHRLFCVRAPLRAQGSFVDF